MESINLILGIVASVVAIASAILTVGNTVRIRKIENNSKSISSGDSSNNTIGNNNSVN